MCHKLLQFSFFPDHEEVLSSCFSIPFTSYTSKRYTKKEISTDTQKKYIHVPFYRWPQCYRSSRVYPAAAATAANNIHARRRAQYQKKKKHSQNTALRTKKCFFLLSYRHGQSEQFRCVDEQPVRLGACRTDFGRI